MRWTTKFVGCIAALQVTLFLLRLGAGFPSLTSGLISLGHVVVCSLIFAWMFNIDRRGFNMFNNHSTKATDSAAKLEAKFQARFKKSCKGYWTLKRFIIGALISLALGAAIGYLTQTNICGEGVRCTEN